MNEKQIAAIVIVYDDGSVKKAKKGMAVSVTDDSVTLDCLNMTQGDFINIGGIIAEDTLKIVKEIKQS